MRQTVPMATRAASFCYCPKGGKAQVGWRLDTGTGRWVCSHCGKPAPLTGLRNCEECENEFIDFNQPRNCVTEDGRMYHGAAYCPNCK